jgi:2-hydroxychromene-2-carboxylate isomerase
MRVEFFFDYRSPFAYLANTQIGELAAEPVFRPIDGFRVMKAVNNRPSPECPPKARYSALDAARWARRYGVAYAPNHATHGLPATLWHVASDPVIADRLAAQNEEAAARGVFGVPSFFVAARLSAASISGGAA